MKYSVVGGGVSGLSTAYYLAKYIEPSLITVYESSSRVGGWIESTKPDDGFIYEHGPRTIRPVGRQGANTLQLAEELGLQHLLKPIKYGHPATTNRQVLADGKLHQLPASMGKLFSRQPPFSKPLFMAAVKDMFTVQKKCDDESLHAFVSRRLGADLANFAIDPLVRGVCAGDAREISAKAFVAGPLFELEQQYGGIVKGMIMQSMPWNAKPQEPEETSTLVKRARAEKWSVWSLEGGLSLLPETLKAKLEDIGVNVKTGTQLDKKDVNSQGVIAASDFTFWTTPANVTAQYFGPIPEIQNLLDSIPFVDVAVVNVMFDGNLLPSPAFGFLVPSTEKNVPILGVIYDSCSFPQGGDTTIMTVMMGGAWFEPLFGRNPRQSDLEMVAVDQLKKILKISVDPTRVICKVQKKCIAQYTIGHVQRVQKLRSLAQKLPVAFSGSSYDGVGINDAIMSSRKQVDQLFGAK